MTSDRPTERLPDQHRWDWNQLQTERESTDTSFVQSREGGAGTALVTDGPSQTTIEQKEQQLQSIINQYERLLTEKNRRLANRESAEPIHVKALSSLSRFRRWLIER